MFKKQPAFFQFSSVFLTLFFLTWGCGTRILPVSPYTNSITRAPSLKYSSLYLYNPNPFLVHVHLQRSQSKHTQKFAIPPESTFNTLVAHGIYELVLVELGEKSKIALRPKHKYQLTLKAAGKGKVTEKNK